MTSTKVGVCIVITGLFLFNVSVVVTLSLPFLWTQVVQDS